jgi:hypothetical protein
MQSVVGYSAIYKKSNFDSELALQLTFHDEMPRLVMPQKLQV